MPPADQWESYFDAAGILECLGCLSSRGDTVEFGCGYGTFTIPAARIHSGILYALDIDPLMVAATTARVSQLGLENVIVEQRDFVTEGCGRKPRSAECALLFNILHIEDPVGLMTEAHRILRPGGLAAVIHWNYDSRTPRGPPLDIRPRPEQCRSWAEAAGFRWVRSPLLPRSPWHWGMTFQA